MVNNYIRITALNLLGERRESLLMFFDDTKASEVEAAFTVVREHGGNLLSPRVTMFRAPKDAPSSVGSITTCAAVRTTS